MVHRAFSAVPSPAPSSRPGSSSVALRLSLGLALLSALACRATDAPPSSARPSEDLLLVETEAFDDLGGWVLDQQFMDLMGSPYLLAHGMGVPVADATTTVVFPHAGPWRVWARTRDWVAPWGVEGAPGRFEVHVDGRAVPTTFGTEGEPWHWQDGGTITVEPGRSVVALRDLTGFEGRCDALLFAADLGYAPPDALAELTPWRRALRGLPDEPRDGGTFDLVVVGGGMAGTAAAVTAAREGLTVALVQDRPVLGGNASSEVRVWPEGHVNQQPYPRLGDVVMELVPERRADSKNAQGAHVFDDDRKLRVARGEEHLTLFLERRMNEAQATDDRIDWVVAEDVRTGERTRLRGRWFLDSTGDGSLGFLVGADFAQTDEGHMGASNLWNIQCLCEDEDPLSSELAAAIELAAFPRVPWAVDLRDKPFPGRDWGAKTPKPDGGPVSIGNWYWENGFDRDPIADMERIRDQNFRAMYGAWDAIKNVEGRYPAHRLNWVAYIAGKRESRRLLGDVILTAEDLRDGVRWEDGSFPCTWGIDTHHPDERYADGHAGDEFIADYTRGEGYEYDGPYWVPYRCLYSRNVANLFMAGRDISVTHEALGAVRVMKTTGAMGEVVGLAAAVCKQEDCDPRAVYTDHWDELEARLRVGAGKRTPLEPAADGAWTLTARAARVHGPTLRYEADRDCLGYWRSPEDQASWDLVLDEAAEFTLSVTYACPADEAGARGEVSVDERVAAGFVVRDSGSWDDYRTVSLGTLSLDAGTHRLRLQASKDDGPRLKLRALALTPQP